MQCAEILEREYPDDPELIAAGLVHDVASHVSPGIECHEDAGAALVEPLLGERVARLVQGHVVAKRYLVTTDPEYRATLSERSLETLLLQGDLLDDAQVAELESRQDFAAIVALRRADEQAKDPERVSLPLETWRALLEQLANR